MVSCCPIVSDHAFIIIIIIIQNGFISLAGDTYVAFPPLQLLQLLLIMLSLAVKCKATHVAKTMRSVSPLLVQPLPAPACVLALLCVHVCAV